MIALADVIRALIMMVSDGWTVTLSWITRQLRRPVSLVKRPVPAVWIEPDEAWGDVLATVQIQIATAVDMTKSIEKQERRRVVRAERESRARLIEDELGSWDPDAVDWSEPAIYVALGRECFTRGLGEMVADSTWAVAAA